MRRLLRSFQCALRGIWVARSGANLRIHAAATAAVVVLVLAYQIAGSRLGLVVLAVTTVIAAELVNTAIEQTCDLIAELHGIGQDDRIRDIKDLAAGAVLITALGAALLGLIVFGPLLT